MKKALLIATTALVAACSGMNDYPVLPSAPIVRAAPVEMPQEPSVRDMDPSEAIGSAVTYIYREGEEKKVFIPHGRVVPISLLPGDTFEKIAGVDMSGCNLDDSDSGKGRKNRSVLMVSSIPGQGCNMHAVLVASNNVYLLHMIARKSGHAAVSFHKPPRILPAAAAVSSGPSYGIAGPAVPWRPVGVSDDGRKTTVAFSPAIGATGTPAVLVAGPDGEARPVNSRRIGDGVLIDGVYPKLLFRLGEVEVQAIRR